MTEEDPQIFDVTETDGVHVLQLRSDMFADLHVAAFRRQLLQFVDQHPAGNLVVNMDKVQTFGSENIGILVHGLNRVKRGGGDLRLCSLSKLCMKLFQICNLIPQVFATYSSSADAIKSYQ